MLKRAVKDAVRKTIAYMRKRKRFSSLCRRDKALVLSHPEWVGLTREEKTLMLDKNIWAYIAFKNVRGVLEYGHVSDSFYQTVILPFINANEYTGMFQSIESHNIFSNKNYYNLMLKYLPMPETVIRRINGVFMDKDYNILSDEAALDKVNEHERLVFKPAKGTGHGKNVSCIDQKDFKEALTNYANYDNGGGLHRSNGFKAA